MATVNQIASVFELLHLPVPSRARLQRIASDGRSVGEVRDDLLQYLANRDGIPVRQALARVIRQTFQSANVSVGSEGSDRLFRIADEILSGSRTLNEVTRTIRSFSPEPTAPDGGGGGGGGGGGDGGDGNDDPDPDPDPESDPEEDDPVDFHEQVRALYPFLPEQLVDIFAEAWADSGDQRLALAQMRASDAYDQFFAGNRRPDGSLRHTEAEYFSIKDAFRTTYQEFGLNPALFEDRFTELIENDQSPREHAARLGAAFEQVVNNIPQVREAYARFGNIQMTDQAIFASVIDPTIGEAIVNRRISVAQVAGEGLARGFDVDEDFAGRLTSGGVDQMTARTLFSDAEGRLSTLDTLVRRHRDPDDDFDLEEFAAANVFGDARQNQRIQRALRAEAAMFSGRGGTTATTRDFQLRGLSAR